MIVAKKVLAKKVIAKELLESQLADDRKPEDLIGENGLLKQFTKLLVEEALGGKMGKSALAGRRYSCGKSPPVLQEPQRRLSPVDQACVA